MKIAIPMTRDQRISAHFGHSPAFLVLDVDQGRILHREVRLNDQATAHPDHGHDPGRPHGHGRHDHGRFVRLLGDCRAVVGLGMGPGVRFSLESAGILVRILQAPCTPEEAAIRFEGGDPEAGPRPSCRA